MLEYLREKSWFLHFVYFKVWGITNVCTSKKVVLQENYDYVFEYALIWLGHTNNEPIFFPEYSSYFFYFHSSDTQ